MLIAARSMGRPSRLLRRVSVTNSSISLPTWSEDPISTLPAACAGVRVPVAPPAKYSGGLRNAVSSGIESSVTAPLAGSSVFRATVSSSMEWPNR